MFGMLGVRRDEEDAKEEEEELADRQGCDKRPAPSPPTQ